MAIGPFWLANIALAAVNAILVTGLLSMYLRNFRAIKSTFALGLLVFAGLFLVQNLAALMIFLDFATEYTAEVAIPLLVTNSLQTVGFSALLWVSLR